MGSTTLEKEYADSRASLESWKAKVDEARKAGREWSEDDRKGLRDALLAFNGVAEKVKAHAEDGTLWEALGSALDSKSPLGNGGIRTYKSIGDAVTRSDFWDTVQLERKTSRRFSTPTFDTGFTAPGHLDAKALTTVGTVLGGYQEGPRVDLALNRPTVASLLAQGTMSGSMLTYLRETVATNAAAAVAEGGLKPSSTLTLVRVNQALSKIATIIDVPDEVLDDLDQARSYIDGRLTLFIQLEEEEQILYGDGTGANMTGIFNTSGTQTETAAASTDNFDALYRAITKVRTIAFLEPDGVAINPMDYQFLRLQRDANEQFYGGGPFTGAYGNTPGVVTDPGLWGLRTVITPAVTAGVALLGAFQAGAMLFRKGGISVDITNSDEGKFKNNISTIRAEERAALAVFRPNAFVEVTLDTVVEP
jgi:hypothetical protein